MKVIISQVLLDTLQQAAATATPLECCGFIVGDFLAMSPPFKVKGELEKKLTFLNDAFIEDLIPTPNVSPTPQTHFEIGPAALVAAHRANRNRLIGYYHSHPSRDAEPSLTDIAHAHATNTLWIIIAGKITRVFITMAPHRFAECEIIVT